MILGGREFTRSQHRLEGQSLIPLVETSLWNILVPTSKRNTPYASKFNTEDTGILWFRGRIYCFFYDRVPFWR